MLKLSDKMGSPSEEEAESCRAISGSFFNSLLRNITVTAGVNSCSCACHFLIYRDGEGTSTFRPANFTYEACKRHKNSLKLCLRYIMEEVKSMKFTFDGLEMYSTAKEDFELHVLTNSELVTQGQVIRFTSGSVNYSLTSYQHNINLRAMDFKGMMLDSLVSVPAKLFSYIRNAPCTLVESPVLRIGHEKKRKVMWSSLPVLILWIIKDKLDIFDNWRLAAVCRDWQSASARYPRALHSVGDGVPWLLLKDFYSSCIKVFSFASNSKRALVVEDPEFAKTAVEASKEGWLLLRKRTRSLWNVNSHMFLINLFTRAKMNLPALVSSAVCYGSFTVSADGIPERVFLCRRVNGTTNIVETACPGDDEWTSYTFSWPKEEQGPSHLLISIGQKVYFQDYSSQVTVYDVANRSCKKLPPLGSGGFIAEHRGGLIYIERGRRLSDESEDGSDDIDYDCSSYAVYKHNDAAPNSWEKLDKSEVMDTSWFLWSYGGCIAAKGEGLKVYDLRQTMAPGKCYFSRRDIAVYDLNAGTAEVFPNPFQVGDYGLLQWIAIG